MLSALNLILTGINTFSAFIFFHSTSNMRMAIYIFGFIISTIAIVLMWVCTSALNFQDVLVMPKETNFNNFIFVIIIAALYIVTIIATFFINLRKYRVGYLLSGALILLCTILIITANGRIFRNAE
jgi:hypothetical protein